MNFKLKYNRLAQSPGIGGPIGIFELFNSFLKKAVSAGASDIHLGAGCPIRFRIKGELLPVQDSPLLTPADTVAIAEGLLIAAKKATPDRAAQVAEIFA